MTDYIKREDALFALCSTVHFGEEVPCRNQIVSCRWNATSVQDYADSILSIPSADVAPVQRWIPVTERLPEKPEGYPKCEIRRTYYLVALKSGCVMTLGYEFDRDEWQITGSPVVAWMPLPEPPKEGSE